MNYFLAPRSGEKSHANFESTIRSGVPFERIRPHLSPEGLRELANEEVIYAWGNRIGMGPRWEKMQYGDTVIFYARGQLVLTGEVYYKQQSPQLALAMWPPDEKGNPWEYTFFLRNLRYISLPFQIFAKTAGYPTLDRVQGFMPLKDPYLSNIQRVYGSVENFLYLFSDDKSSEVPFSSEPIHVNLHHTIEPVIIDKANISPMTVPKRNVSINKKPLKTDHSERNRKNAITGSRGEELVLKAEKKRLLGAGRKDLSDLVDRVSLKDDSCGYDIMSYEIDGRMRPIEVKTSTTKPKDIRFYMSANEVAIAETLDNYHLYYVEEPTSNKPTITIIPDPINKKLFTLVSESFLVYGMRT